MTRQPRRLADLPDNISLADLRRAWGEQEGIRLLRSEQGRHRGKRTTWELWVYVPKRPPPRGPRRSFIVVTWWRAAWDTAVFLTRGEAIAHMDDRGGVASRLLPPMLVRS